MNKIVYVILHYLTIDDTIKCVESILKSEKHCFEIVVVDNNSPNNSGIELEQKYKSNKNIHVIINEKNLGFSAGNNIGFKYAKYELKADYIVLLNNDTYLLQDNFGELVVDSYKKYKFGVMGPKIHTKDSICGPLWEIPFTKESLKRELLKLKIKLFAKYINVNLKKFWKKSITEEKEYINVQDDVVLHGCFLIFSPLYIKKFDGLSEKTFFYGEEIILYNRMNRNNLKILFNPNLEIFHNEFSSTNFGIDNNKTKEINRMKRLIKALKIIIKDWDND